MNLFLWLAFAATLVYADESAANLARAIRTSGLDPQECYRVRDLAFQKEDIKFYLTDGHVIFSKPVAGKPLAIVFTTDVPGGDGEVMVFPPHRSERQSLASFAKTPNLNEHFSAAVFLFTDDTGARIRAQIEALTAKKAPEAGILIDQSFTSVLKNLASSYETRLVQDILNGNHENGFLYAALQGKQLGNFDVIYDARAREQVLIGQLTFREDRPFWNTWTSFRARSFRKGQKVPAPDSLKISAITIDATIEPSLHMKATTRLVLTGAPQRAINFDISQRMKVTEARIDGQPAEIFLHDSLRSNLVRGGENESFLVVAPQPLALDQTHTIDFIHEGEVIQRSGNGTFYVGSRASWYPNREASFAKYEVTFRYPKNLNLVATGEAAEDKIEGDRRITRRVTPAPIRFAGFNLGDYEKVSVQRSGFTVEVNANRTVESALQRREPVVVLPQTGPAFGRQGRRQEIAPMPITLPPPNPAARLHQLATEVTSAMEFMSLHLGPPPLKRLTVAPIPGTFGQGFPGLIYLSTLAYLNPADRPVSLRTEYQRTFFSELLHAHETAHQWWGNLVTSGHYQDDWLMEALSSYSALMFFEKRKGRKALEEVLEAYRDDLVRTIDGGRTIESAGPIVWGIRLNSSLTPDSWRTIMYEKGAWIIHMLRSRLGDAQFLKMLGEVVRQKQYKPLSTDEFKSIASGFLPARSEDPKLEAFFDQWVYGTGIPSFRMKHTIRGRKLSGTISQADVDDDFSALVPVEVQLPGKRSITRWVRTSSEPVAFELDLPAAPVKVILNPGSAVLTARN